jgi:putative endopeptidase
MMKSLLSIFLVLGAVLVVTTAALNQDGKVRMRINNDELRLPEANESDLAKQILAIMNTSVDPCTDFYEYACGTWVNTYPLPPDASRFGMAFDQIAQDNQMILRGILEDPAGEWPIIGPFYNSCMNMDARNKLGAEPALSILDQVQVDDVVSFMSAVGYLHSIGLSTLFSAGVGVDAMHPTNNMFIMGQGGLSLDVPSDYDDQKLATQFAQYAQQIFTLAGQSSFAAKTSAYQVLATERSLAKISLSPAALRDPYATYNNLTLAQLYALTPNIAQEAWDAYFTNAGLHIDASDLTYVIDVETPTFFSNLSLLLDDTQDFSVWETYLRWAVLNQLAPSLSQDFVDANFNFFGMIYSGKKQNTPLWKRCVQQTDLSLGELLGRYYVLQDFPALSKQMASDLVQRIEDAFLANLANVDWMDDATRKLAAQKLSMVKNLIGYPEHWKDYSGLSISADYFVDNVVTCNQFSTADQFAQLTLPVNKARWEMTPPTVNAYYDPTLNEMVFPAGILQSPWFFNATYPPQINFAGIGSVMGHELTHGFDDQGANYDGTGKLHQWWPPAVKQRFQQRTECVSNLYSSFEVLPGLYVNGNLTLGENVADIGGLHESFIAYQTYAKSLPTPPPEILPGKTDKQMFFIAYALHWCEVDTPEALRRQVNSNPHSPARFRVNGPLSQLPQFTEAFSCPAGSAMNPAKRCNIW